MDRSYSKWCYGPLFIVISVILPLAMAEVLADSGYPMYNANGHRNNQINRPILCPDVAPGRSQVLNLKWKWPPSNYSFSFGNSDFTLDGQGSIYVQGRHESDSIIMKINAVDGSFNPGVFFELDTFDDVIPTHVEGNKFYLAFGSKTVVINSKTMTQLSNLHPESAPYSSNYAPLGTNYMVTANRGLDYGSDTDLLAFFKVSSASFDTSQNNFRGGDAQDVLVYKDTMGDIPIVVSQVGGNPSDILIQSPKYKIRLNDTSIVRAMIQEDELIIIGVPAPLVDGDLLYNSIYAFNASTGVILRNISLTQFQGKTVFQEISSMFLARDKTISAARDGQRRMIVDLLNQELIFEGKVMNMQPLYSKVNNAVLAQISTSFETQELVVLDWDDYSVKAKGLFPLDGAYSDYITSRPIVGDNCYVYGKLNDYSTYNNLLAFAPIPIQNIKPILECVSANGIGFFSYRNYEPIDSIIPQFEDRNNLSPLEVAPVMQFLANKRGKFFPFATQYNLGTNSTNRSFSWKLEDYSLPFTVGATLRCPVDVNFVLTFKADGNFNSTNGFEELVRETFCETMNINCTRVVIVHYNVTGTSATIELQVVNQNGSSPLEIVLQFAADYLTSFESAVKNNDLAPLNLSLTDIDGVPLSTSLEGTLPPVSPPISTNNPSSESPQSEPNGSVSAGHTLHVVATMNLACLLLAVLSVAL